MKIYDSWKDYYSENKFEIKDLTPELAKSSSIFYVNNR